MKIFLVEDDPQISSFVKLGLESKNCIVEVAYDGIMAEKLVQQKQFDVIILDVVIPGISGFELCKRIRNRNIKTPVLMLTSLNSTEDKVLGFDSGADDYLLKPFVFQELFARLQALNRRSKDLVAIQSIKISDLEVDLISKKVKRGNEEIKLTALEFRLLELLVSHKGKVFDRIEIGEKLWGFSFNTGTNAIDVHIHSLRNKIDKGHPTELIHTVKGMGFSISDEN